jgi:tripartite ATP-independent transporter DctP family solute receptor
MTSGVLPSRRAFLAGLGAAATGACGPSGASGRHELVLRLSHSMVAATNSLHVYATAFRDRLEAGTGGSVTLRLFASSTLGQEREVVQQLQEGLIDFMISGSAIWGSVAPRLQVLDFPFLWHDPAHIHRVVDGPLGVEIADYLSDAARIRPLSWGDSFGFRNVVTRSKAISEPEDFAGLKIRTIQSAIYVKTVALLGASPTPMPFGEVYTSLQTGVIDGFEHDASTTLQQRYYEVAKVMTRTRHIAGVLGLWMSNLSASRLPREIVAAAETAAREASVIERTTGPREEAAALTTLAGHGMAIRDMNPQLFADRAEALWDREARALGIEPWLHAIREGAA